MQFTATFLSLVVLLSSASAHSSLKESCGTDAQIIDKKTLATASGKELTITTTSCPGFVALRNVTTTPSTVRKRQIEQCGFQCNSFACDTTAAQPDIEDCNTLSSELDTLNEWFTLPPYTSIEFDAGTCFYIYANFDTVTYDVCSAGIAAWGQNTALYCQQVNQLATFTAGFCISPQVPGNDFVVESGFFSA